MLALLSLDNRIVQIVSKQLRAIDQRHKPIGVNKWLMILCCYGSVEPPQLPCSGKWVAERLWMYYYEEYERPAVKNDVLVVPKGIGYYGDNGYHRASTICFLSTDSEFK